MLVECTFNDSSEEWTYDPASGWDFSNCTSLYEFPPEVCVPTCRSEWTQLLDVYAAWPSPCSYWFGLQIMLFPPWFCSSKSASDSIFLDVHPKTLKGFLTHQSNWGCSTSLAGILHVANTCCCSTHVPDVSSPSTTNISPFRLRNRVKQVAVEMKNGSQVEIRNFESLGSRDAIFIEKRF